MRELFLCLLAIIIAVGLMILGAYVHEHDMLNQIRKENKCIGACWSTDIEEVIIIKEK